MRVNVAERITTTGFVPGQDASVLVFSVHDATCAVELSCVSRVLLLPALEPLPMGPSYLRGTLSVGGSEAVVFDLAERLKIEGRRPYDLATPLLLCHRAGEMVGMIVTSALGVVTGRARPSASPSAAFLGSMSTELGRALLLDSEWLFAIDTPARPCAEAMTEDQGGE
jgi:chemotaxis signal transduction protein